MNVESPSAEAMAGANPAAAYTPVSSLDIDRSCRMPVLFLLTKGAGWLVVALVLALLSSIKLHSGTFLAHCPWLTYGRLFAASQSILVYGFASQAGLGLGLWMLARLGRTKLQGPGFITVAAIFWNLGVLAGTLGILSGDNTGYEWLEFPRYSSALIFASYLAIGVCALLTFHNRREPVLYVSQWFLLAALLWFPWVYSTAQLLLILSPVRGALQIVVNGWFEGGLFNLWLTPLGVAAIFYFLPKLLRRPLYSQYWAMLAFWMLAVFGGWGTVHPGAPVPKWVSTAGIAASIMLVLPIVALAANWYITWKQDKAPAKGASVLKFVTFSALCFVLASALGILGSLRSIAGSALFTVYSPGVTQLYFYGFLAMIVAGGTYYVVPRLIESDETSLKSVSLHFGLGVAGVVLGAISLVIGGVVQGAALNNPSVASIDIARSILPFVGMSTLGILLLLVASLVFLMNLLTAVKSCLQLCCPCVERGTSGKDRRGPAGGKS